MRFRGVIGALTGILLAASCSLGDADDAGSINVYLDTDKGQLEVGESMNITVRALNVGSAAVTLTGPSDCLLSVEVRDNNLGLVVWHSQSQCNGQNVSEELDPGVEKVRTVSWDGFNLAGSRLDGIYNIRGIARVSGEAYVSLPISVQIQ